MSYWSLKQATGLPSDQVDPTKKQPVVPPQQPQNAAPPVTAPAPAPTPAPVDVNDPSQMGGNDINFEKQVGNQGKIDQRQESITPFIGQALNDFKNNHPDIYTQYTQTDKRFNSGLGNFFISNKGAHAMAWYDWFAREAQTLINDQSTGVNWGLFTTPQGIKQWLGNPERSQQIGQGIVWLVNNRPKSFAEAVKAFAPKAESQFGQFGLSNDQQSGTSDKGTLGDNFSDQSRQDQIDQSEGALNSGEIKPPNSGEVAEFWSKQTRSRIIAPEMSPQETTELKGIYGALTENASSTLADIMMDVTEHTYGGAKLSAVLPDFDKIQGQAMQWPLMGISDSEKLGDVALSNWQEYVVKHGVGQFDDNDQLVGRQKMTAQQVVEATQNGQIDDIMYALSLETAVPNSPLFDFMREKSKQFAETAYDIHNTEKMIGTPSEFRPKPGDFVSFNRMSKIAAACAFREWRYQTAKNAVPAEGDDSNIDKGSTALNRWAYLSTKIPATVKKLQQAATGSPGTFVPFGVDKKDSGKQQFLHRGKDGLLYIRHVEFNSDVPLRTKDDVNAYVADPRNGLDEPLTQFNWSKIAGMIDMSSYMPEFFRKTAQIDPNGLKKQPTAPDLERRGDLQKSWDEANKQWLEQNPNEKDHLAMYRKMRGQHIQQMLQGAAPEQIQQILNERIYKGARGPERAGSGANISDQAGGAQWLQSIMAGKEVPYSVTDFDALAWALTKLGKPAQTSELFAPYSYEYDPNYREDHYAMTAKFETAVGVFGRYLVHRKRVQQMRGFDKNTWSNKSMYYFLMMCNPHANYSKWDKKPEKNKPEDKWDYHSDTKTVGAPLMDAMDGQFSLYDLQRNKVNSPDGAQDITNKIDQNVPRSDIYKGQRPSGYMGDEVRPTKADPLGRAVPDESGKVNYDATSVEADPIELWKAYSDSFKNAHPELFQNSPEGVDTTQVMSLMKEEKVKELNESITKRQQDLAALAEPGDAQEKAVDHLADNDAHVQAFINDNQQALENDDPTALQEFIRVRDRRWAEMCRKNNKSPEEFAPLYLQRQQELSQASIEKLTNTLQTVENTQPMFIEDAPPKDGVKRPRFMNPKVKDRFKQQLMMFVPLKYKRKMYGEPGHQTHKTFTPLDRIQPKNYTEVAKANVINLTMKTAVSLDRLSAIRSRLVALAMPTEFVDNVLESIGDEYERQFVVIARREDGRRNAPAAADQKRSRLWSLL